MSCRALDGHTYSQLNGSRLPIGYLWSSSIIYYGVNSEFSHCSQILFLEMVHVVTCMLYFLQDDLRCDIFRYNSAASILKYLILMTLWFHQVNSSILNISLRYKRNLLQYIASASKITVYTCLCKFSFLLNSCLREGFNIGQYWYMLRIFMDFGVSNMT